MWSQESDYLAWRGNLFCCRRLVCAEVALSFRVSNDYSETHRLGISKLVLRRDGNKAEAVGGALW